MEHFTQTQKNIPSEKWGEGTAQLKTTKYKIKKKNIPPQHLMELYSKSTNSDKFNRYIKIQIISCVLSDHYRLKPNKTEILEIHKKINNSLLNEKWVKKKLRKTS